MNVILDGARGIAGLSFQSNVTIHARTFALRFSHTRGSKQRNNRQEQ
jgi:hypothetical protein